jgi:hypothetical protein
MPEPSDPLKRKLDSLTLNTTVRLPFGWAQLLVLNLDMEEA